MRLTQTLREAFVLSAMKDVPSVDYDTQIADTARKMSFDNLPEKLRKFCTANKDMVQFLRTEMQWDFNVMAYVPGKLTDENKAELRKLRDLANAQKDTRQTLRRKLASVAAACNTTKQLADALPEFAKYLPKENAVDRSVPAVANVVSEFVKAGWPGEKK